MHKSIYKRSLIGNKCDIPREKMSSEKKLFSSQLIYNKKKRDCDKFCDLISNGEWPSYNDLTWLDAQIGIKPFIRESVLSDVSQEFEA